MKAVVDFGDPPPWSIHRQQRYRNGQRTFTVYEYGDGSNDVLIGSTLSPHIVEPGPTPYEVIYLGHGEDLPRGCLSIQGDPDLNELRERLDRVEAMLDELKDVSPFGAAVRSFAAAVDDLARS